ncbi:MAG: DUF4403 family protein [Alphaproteobacteria bacterium]|nr:DUF4403 family protein [Alphaproteobacteria bacterium]
MRRRTTLLLTVLVVGLAVGVGWLVRRALGPTAPPRYALGAMPEAPLSAIHLEVTVPMDALERRLEGRVPEVLALVERHPLERGGAVDVEARRVGPVRVAEDAGALRVDFPVASTVVLHPDRERGKEREIESELRVFAHLALALTEDWRLAGRTRLSHAWIRPPTITIGPLTPDLTRLLDPQVEERLVAAAERVDARIEERDELRERVEAVWAKLTRPIPLVEDPPTWLLMAPEAVSAGDLRVEPDGVHVPVGLVARLSVVTEQPDAGAPPPLPPRTEPTGAEGFVLQLPVALDWDTLGALLSERVAGREPEPGVTIRGLTLYPSGRAVVLGVDYALADVPWPLSAEGRAWLSGAPILDAEQQVLTVQGLSVVSGSSSLALDAATSVGAAAWLTWLEGRLEVPLAEHLEAARTRASDALGSAERDGVALSGEVSALHLQDIVLTEEALVVVGRVEGTLAMEAKQLRPLDDAEAPGSPP